MALKAYWVSPEGCEYDLGYQSHIDFLIEHSALFDITRAEIEDVYQKYNEPIRLEGKARRVLMIQALKKGWIRIRDYRNRGYTIELWNFNLKTKDILFNWSRDKPANIPIEIHIIKYEQKDRPQVEWVVRTSVKDVLGGSLKNTNSVL